MRRPACFNFLIKPFSDRFNSAMAVLTSACRFCAGAGVQVSQVMRPCIPIEKAAAHFGWRLTIASLGTGGWSFLLLLLEDFQELAEIDPLQLAQKE